MKSATLLAGVESSTNKPSTMLLTVLGLAVGLLLSSGVLSGQCDSTWALGSSGNWNSAGNWNPNGVPNNNLISACIVDGSSTVTIDNTWIQVADFQLAGGNILNVTNGNYFEVFGGSILNAGTINVIDPGGYNSYLYPVFSPTLSGGGTVNLSTTVSSGGFEAYLLLNNGQTLSNVDNTIQGEGFIVTGSGVLVNQSGGIINANSAGGSLDPYLRLHHSTVNNAGLMEATNNGSLQILGGTVNNAGGNITASGPGASVVVQGGNIVGGTLNQTGGAFFGTPTGNYGYLDGSTGAGAVTLNGTYTTDYGPAQTFLYGSIVNKGTFQVNGGNGSDTYLQIPANVTLSGGGTVNLSTIAANGNNAYLSLSSTLTNVNNTIQGDGILLMNGLTLINQAGGTIDANSTGGTEITALTIHGGGSVTNAGLTEATNNGVLNINAVVVNNAGGTILASGTNSVVNVSTSTSIQGGTLSTASGGVMQTSGSATLDGATQGAITVSDGSKYTAGAAGSGTITYVTGTLNLGTVSGGTLALGGALQLLSNTTVVTHGTGSIAMTNGQIGTDGNSHTLTNNGLIRGSGVIGSNLSVNNTGNISANTVGSTLSMQGTGSIVNTGTLKAVVGGILNLATTAPISNNGGTILSNGAGSVVNVTTAIQGGTLTTQSSGVMQTVTGAQLDGSTNGAITISDGSTYTAGAGTLTNVLGALKLGTSTGGTIALGGNMLLIGDTTLSGPGSMTLSGAAQIGTNGNVYTLTNNSTVQGTGLIGSNIGVLAGNNNLTNGGVIVSNGGTLTLAGSGTLTNTGTLHANAGTTLVSTMSGLSASTYASNTLLTGTYQADAGATLQINALGNTGGEIVTNAGKIILNGVGSSFVDAASLDVLTNLATNATGSGFTITGGRNFTTVGNFTNNGTLTVGSGSTFKVNGNLTNLASGTLNGGIYSISGTFQFNGANIVNNSANITLNGSTSKIIATNGTSGLLNFAKNTALGTFALTGGRSFTTIGNFTNNGILTVGSGSKFNVNGSLTNFAGTTLTGGTYNVTGTLQFNGANIVTNAATITMTGATSKIVDQTGTTNGLANFATNSSTGIFTIASGRNLTTAGAFSNAGTVKVSTGTTFTLASGQSYTQTAGKTVDDGTMAASGGGVFAINTGGIFGNNGTFSGNLTSGGTFNVGDTVNLAGKMAVTGNYVQSSTGTLKADIGGAALAKYDQLNITGSITLGGTLSLQLINGYVPTIGSTFNIANFASKTGHFAAITGTPINANEHFAVLVNPTNITLNVVAGPSPFGFDTATTGGSPSPTPEPASLLLLGSGLAGLAAYRRKLKGA